MRRYWYEEPWGSYRANVHAAIIAREVRRTTFKGEHKLDEFMLKVPEQREREQRSSVFNLFRGMTKGKKSKQ